jgi:hypothetical protein
MKKRGHKKDVIKEIQEKERQLQAVPAFVTANRLARELAELYKNVKSCPRCGGTGLILKKKVSLVDE